MAVSVFYDPITGELRTSTNDEVKRIVETQGIEGIQDLIEALGSTLHQEINKLSESVTKEIGNTNSNMDKLETRVASLEKAVTELSKSNTDVESRITTFSSALLALEERAYNSDQEINYLSSDLDELDKYLEDRCYEIEESVTFTYSAVVGQVTSIRQDTEEAVLILAETLSSK